MNEFFLRFILQRMIGVFDDDLFKYEYVMDASKEEIDGFIMQCRNWQMEQAEMLKREMDLTVLHNKKVLYVGDSITADRYGYRGITTFAAEFDSYNAAVSGATSLDMLRFLKDNIANSSPEIISIMIGTNDSLIIANGKNLVSPDEYRKNISEMLCISKQVTDKVIISTLPPANEEAFCKTHDTNFSNLTNKSIDVLSEIVREEAAKHNVLLNDVANVLRKCDFNEIVEEDGIHLTKTGQRIYAAQWLKSALKMYSL